MEEYQRLLDEKGACLDGIAYARQYLSAKEAWENCTKPEWMLWVLDEFNFADDTKHRRFACWCVRNTPLANGGKVWDLLTDERSRNAVIVAERFCNGEASKEQLASAWAAAWAATSDATSDAAWAAAMAIQANALREIYGFPFIHLLENNNETLS